MTDAAIKVFTGRNVSDGYWARAVVPMALNGGRELHVVYHKYETPFAACADLLAELENKFPGAAIAVRP